MADTATKVLTAHVPLPLAEKIDHRWRRVLNAREAGL